MAFPSKLLNEGERVVDSDASIPGRVGLHLLSGRDRRDDGA